MLSRLKKIAKAFSEQGLKLKGHYPYLRSGPFLLDFTDKCIRFCIGGTCITPLPEEPEDVAKLVKVLPNRLGAKFDWIKVVDKIHRRKAVKQGSFYIMRLMDLYKAIRASKGKYKLADFIWDLLKHRKNLVAKGYALQVATLNDTRRPDGFILVPNPGNPMCTAYSRIVRRVK